MQACFDCFFPFVLTLLRERTQSLLVVCGGMVAVELVTELVRVVLLDLGTLRLELLVGALDERSLFPRDTAQRRLAPLEQTRLEHRELFSAQGGRVPPLRIARLHCACRKLVAPS